MINLENEKEVTYSLKSIFFGFYIIVQGLIYIAVLTLDSIIYSIDFIYISEIALCIISLLISYIVWISATDYSEKNEDSFWGIVVKFIIGLSIFMGLILFASGHTIKQRKQSITEKILFERSIKRLQQNLYGNH